MNYRVLVINPGSTSTKMGVFDGEQCVFQETLRHSAQELAPFAQIMDQVDFRRALVEKVLEEKHIAPESLSAVCARGGQIPPCPSGAFVVDKQMCDYLYGVKEAAHASNLGAVIALLLDWNLIGVQAAALVAGLATMAFTTAISRTRTGSFNVITLVLGGVIVSALANAVLSLLKLTADPTSQLPEITYWLMGSLAAVTYHQIALGAPFIITGVVVIVALRWQLNILSLSEDEARSAGVNVSLMRAILIVASTVITASVISMCGQVGWVGLLVPHCARMLCGQNNRAVIPVSLLLGSALMIVIDTLARSLSASEIPISILTAIIGAPFFIVLLRRTGGAR